MRALIQSKGKLSHGNGIRRDNSECAVNQILKSVVREIRTLRSVGVGASSGCPFYPAELEIELVATTPALYSSVIHTPLSYDFFLKSRISNLLRRCTVSNGNQYQMSELRLSIRWCPRGFREVPNSIFLPDD